MQGQCKYLLPIIWRSLQPSCTVLQATHNPFLHYLQLDCPDYAIITSFGPEMPCCFPYPPSSKLWLWHKAHWPIILNPHRHFRYRSETPLMNLGQNFIAAYMANNMITTPTQGFTTTCTTSNSPPREKSTLKSTWSNRWCNDDVMIMVI